MEYYEIWVASTDFHGKEPLTYSSELPLSIGEIVKIPLQNKHSLGIVNKRVSKPRFKTKNAHQLNNRPKTPLSHIELLKWLTVYYPSPLGQITSLFVPQNLDTKSRQQNDEESQSKSKPISPPKLTNQQKEAIKKINNTNDPVILHGDTGTGKTRVYIEAVKQNLQSGKSSIILTPEIGLTPQLVQSFSEIFSNQILLVHSNLTPAQRRKAWLKCANSIEPQIVIGPRSALFMPVTNLGLIVIDEFHDTAYKQEQAPHYQTSRVAAKLAKITNSSLILGSATPSVSDYYVFESKKLPIIRMTELAKSSEKSNEVKIEIVKINDRLNFGSSFWLSNKLIEAIKKSLDKGEQSLVYLNRRGSARIAMCQKCGWQAVCPKCDIPLTYHGDIHRLQCHTCGFKTMAPSACPDCKSADIEFNGIGTKAITNEIERIFPNARVARFDSDNLKIENLSSRYQDVKSGNIDILVGTQTLTKGLDLPKLSVVGVVSADTALSFPDYTAEEVTFQQLTQVIGRVGRGHTDLGDSKVIIQTFYPDNSALKAIVDKNYSLFYEQQLSERKRFQFPPYLYILKLSCGRKSSKSAENAIIKLNKNISELPLDIEVIGPAPSFKHKQNDKYYWQLIIKAKKRQDLTSVINSLPANVSYDIDPTNLL